MAGLGKEIEGLDFGELVIVVSEQVLQIADLGGGIAGNVDDAGGGEFQ